jgi:putative lipoprotein (rSAM/lipoprotein system)
MAPIKLKFLNSFNSLIAVLISILGFSSSCKKEETRLAYGIPHADFIIHGEVKSSTDNKLIPDIIIEVRETRLVETGFSTDNGSYELAVRDFPADHTYKIKFTDTDGALNGEYETLDTTVVFKDPKFANGDGSWYAGYTEKELNIKLKPKK